MLLLDQLEQLKSYFHEFFQIFSITQRKVSKSAQYGCSRKMSTFIPIHRNWFFSKSSSKMLQFVFLTVQIHQFWRKLRIFDENLNFSEIWYLQTVITWGRAFSAKFPFALFLTLGWSNFCPHNHLEFSISFRSTSLSVNFW